MPTTPTFRASGLASGLDTTSIVNDLVKIESRTIDLTRKQQDAFKAQVSSIGDVMSKLTALRTAASALGANGALAVRASSTNSGFSASPSSSAASGRYSLQVDELAQAARGRSQAFAGGATAQVTGGTLGLTIDGATTSVTLDDGMTLTQAADRINRSGAAVSASVLETNGQSFLSVTRRDTGFVVGQPASSALQIAEISSGSMGQPLGLAITQPAVNALVTVDGLSFERRGNVIADVVPGTTISLSRKTTTPEDLVLATSTTDTQAALKRFTDAYNDAMKVVRGALAIGEQTDRRRTLGGDPSLRGLQSALQGLVVGEANPGSSVRTLADVGIKTQTDGSLSIDATRLERAIAADPSAVNALFQTATTGIAAATTTMVDRFTLGSNSILELRKSGLDRSIRQLDSRIESLQLRVDSFRERLVKQFTAMEKVVGQFKSIGDFLTSREKQGSKE
ncbi:MAG: flagellar filament capping protein FliD [Myxococcaceae bacterium]|nr:flagellar filament capping protein FliD [Myxococcaceae bacterium]